MPFKNICTAPRRRPPFRSRPHQRRRVSATCLSASRSRRHTPACPAARPISGRRSAAASDGRHSVRAPSRCAAAWHASICTPTQARDEDRCSADCISGGDHFGRCPFSEAASSTRCQLEGRFCSQLGALRSTHIAYASYCGYSMPLYRPVTGLHLPATCTGVARGRPRSNLKFGPFGRETETRSKPLAAGGGTQGGARARGE
jgi:hypothetical protein